jgi:hypothetical protein
MARSEGDGQAHALPHGLPIASNVRAGRLSVPRYHPHGRAQSSDNGTGKPLAARIVCIQNESRPARELWPASNVSGISEKPHLSGAPRPSVMAVGRGFYDWIGTVIVSETFESSKSVMVASLVKTTSVTVAVHIGFGVGSETQFAV